MPVYDLMVADGARFAAMKPGDCVKPEQAVPLGPLSCGGVRKQLGPRQVLEAASISMGKFAELLSDEVGRPVVDKTGFPGSISFRLEFASARDLAPAAAAATLKATGYWPLPTS